MTEPRTNPPSAGTAPILSGRTIVVIDDDASLLMLMRNYLRRAGADVHVAENGRDAWASLEQLSASPTPPHAVLCDLRMENGSGMELYRRVCEETPALKARLIFSSGDITSDDVRSFVEQCDVRVLEKPYPLADLRTLLAELPPVC